MKKITLFLAVAAILASCNPLSKMAKYAESIKYDVQPNPLEMHGDSVAVSLSGKFPPNYFHKLATVTATPTMKNEAGEVVKAFEPIKLVGTDVQEDGQKIDFTKGGSFTYEDKLPYDAKMEMVNLTIDVVAGYKTKTKDFGSVDLGTGTVITPMMVRSDEKPIMGADKFNRITPKSSEGQINYLINSAQVRGSELRDADVAAMKDFIAEGAEKGWTFKGLSVSAYASPDGELSKNENLANDRAASAAKSVGSMLKRKKIDAAKDDAFFTKEGKGEDWAGFKKAMQASDIPDKDMIIRILEMTDDVNKREEEIKAISKTYLVLADQILPGLRRSQMKLMAEEVGKSDEEIKQLASSDPAQLNAEELMYASTLTDDINEKMKIYESFKKQFASDWRGPNNAGCVYLMQGKVSDAQGEFEAAAKLASNGTINNNLGIIAMKSGDRDKATELYQNATGSGPEVGYNMAIVHVKNGNYEDAVDNMGSDKSFNSALAQMLNGDNEGALNTIEASDDKETADGYYLKAVIGARTGNADLMTKNLKAAIGKDGKLKAKAKKDAEFTKYKDDANFTGIVN